MMTVNEQEPLDTAIWFERMARFVQGLREAEGKPDHHIRKAYHLLCLAPKALKQTMPDPVEESRLEAMLECGAYESAVASIFGAASKVSIKTSNSTRGVEACMHIDPRAPESTRETWATAMLDAWAGSYLSRRPLPN